MSSPDMKVESWCHLVFEISAAKVLSYSKQGVRAVCGALNQLVVFRAADMKEEFPQAPSSWHGMLLEFDETVPEGQRVLRLAARTPKEQCHWLDTIALNVPRFRVPPKTTLPAPLSTPPTSAPRKPRKANLSILAGNRRGAASSPPRSPAAERRNITCQEHHRSGPRSLLTPRVLGRRGWYLLQV